MESHDVVPMQPSLSLSLSLSRASMVCFSYLLQALMAITLPAGILSWGLLPFQSSRHQLQPVPQSQTPLDAPGCDGSGIVEPGGRCNGDGLVDSPPDHRDREGFKFENPSTDCKYVSQMHIWDSFKDRGRTPSHRRSLQRPAAFLCQCPATSQRAVPRPCR